MSHAVKGQSFVCLKSKCELVFVVLQELDQMKHYNTKKEEEMQTRHALEKRRLPKILKAEAKTRAQMFKQSLRLSTIGTPDDDKVKIKQVGQNGYGLFVLAFFIQFATLQNHQQVSSVLMRDHTKWSGVSKTEGIYSLVVLKL